MQLFGFVWNICWVRSSTDMQDHHPNGFFLSDRLWERVCMCVCVCVCVCVCECVFLLSYPLPIQSLTHTYEDIRNVYAWGNFVIATALSCLFPNLSLFFLIYFRFFLFHSFFLSRSHFRLFAQKLVHKRLSPSSQRFRSGLSLALVPLVQNVPAGA